jgi:hypothetical protein
MLAISKQLSRDVVGGMAEGQHTEQKFLGFIPPEVSGIVSAVWNGSFALFSDKIREGIFKGVQWGAQKAGHGGAKHLVRNSAIAATAVTGIAALAPFLQPFVTTRSEQRHQMSDAAKRIAPVLDEMKGKHGIGAFASVKITDNEMIYAHRKRLSAGFGVQHTQNLIRTLKASPVIVEKLYGLKGYVASKVPTQNAVLPAASPTGKNEISANGVLALVSTSIAPVLDGIADSKEKRFNAKRQPYTALDMVLTLEGQLSLDSHTASYDLPTGGSGHLPLKQYVAEILRQHQKDMNALDVEYTPIRKALDPRLEEISGIVADALKSGDLSALALIRLVGEGHIIKNKGRSLARPADVKALVKKMSAAPSTYSQLDPKEYFAEAAFNAKELKEALHALEGEERLTFAAMVPDAVLREVGLSDKEVKDIRAATLKSYEDTLGKAVLGLAKEDDAALQDKGLAKEEIALIREAAGRIASEGKDAVHELRAKAGSPKGEGVERILLQGAIHQIHAKDTTYLGTLVQKGAAAMKDAGDMAEAAISKAQHSSRNSHAKREHSRREEAQHEDQEIGA